MSVGGNAFTPSQQAKTAAAQQAAADEAKAAMNRIQAPPVLASGLQRNTGDFYAPGATVGASYSPLLTHAGNLVGNGGSLAQPLLNPAQKDVGLGALYTNMMNTEPSHSGAFNAARGADGTAAQAARAATPMAVPGSGSLLKGAQAAATMKPVGVVSTDIRKASIANGAGAPVAAQQSNLSRLLLSASGDGGPSAAEGALLTASRNNIGALSAIAANVRGGGAAAAGHAAGMQGQDAALAAQAQIGQLRAGEQQAARDQLRQLLSGQREQDLTGQRDVNTAKGTARAQDITNFSAQNTARQGAAAATTNAAQVGVNAFTAQSNAGLKSRELDDAAMQNSIANYLGMSVDDVNFQNIDNNTKLAIANFLQQEHANRRAGDANASQAHSAAIGATFAPIEAVARGGGATLATLLASDRRAKRNIGKLDDAEVRALLDGLEPSTFEYTEPERPGRASGKRFGIMAQDLEKTPMGASLVRNVDARTKGIDIGQATGALFATAASLHRRLASLEGGA